jgi:hypothetical protein
MKRNLLLWQFGGLTFATTLGTILHFVFDWTNLALLASVSAVNESTWEHMKILFFPMLIFALIQYPFFKEESPGFWWIKWIGTLIAVGAIPILFYTYNGAFGKTPDWLNILFFYLAAGLGYYVEGVLFRKRFATKLPFIGAGLLAATAIIFVLFTYFPPHLPLFQDPITKGYGIVVSTQSTTIPV